jgi:ferrous iron transport protein A
LPPTYPGAKGEAMKNAGDISGGHHKAKTCHLNELEAGASGSVVSVNGDRDLRRRLLEMGFCNGVTVHVIRRAPLGDPIEFSLRGYHLSLRAEQAKHVIVKISKGLSDED